MAELPDRVAQRERSKGVSLYSIVSAQAGGIADLALRVIAATKLDEWKQASKIWLDELDTLCDTVLKKSLEDATTDVWNAIVNATPDLIDAWKAGIGLGMGTAFMGLEETYMGLPHLLGIYKTTQIDTAIRSRLERYWNTVYYPAMPDVRTAFRMLMHKRLDRKEYNQICLEEGWESKWHDKLYDIQTSSPDIFMGFSMRQRGLIKTDKLKEIFSINRWDSSWYDTLEKALYRVPTLRELTTLSDFVALPDLYVRQTLRAGQYSEGDIPYLAEAIAMRPLREEVRSVVGRFLWEYQIGRRTRDSVKENLTKLGLKPKEIELNLTWGDMRYQDELLDEKLAIIEQRVKAGDPDLLGQTAIKNAVVALGVLEEKANLMAERLYYQYVYVPRTSFITTELSVQA